jgi:hypothetical protein
MGIVFVLQMGSKGVGMKRAEIGLKKRIYGLVPKVLGLWCLMTLSTIFQLYRGGHFIGGGNRITQRKPPSTPRHEQNSNSQL